MLALAAFLLIYGLLGAVGSLSIWRHKLDNMTREDVIVAVVLAAGGYGTFIVAGIAKIDHLITGHQA